MKVKVAQPCPTLYNPMDYTAHGILQARILEWVSFPFSRGSSQPRDQTHVACIAGRFFTSWATREAQEYWSRSLSLLQGTFLIQELNPGVLHCRWILYQLSYQGTVDMEGQLYVIHCQLQRGISIPNPYVVRGSTILPLNGVSELPHTRLHKLIRGNCYIFENFVSWLQKIAIAKS